MRRAHEEVDSDLMARVPPANGGCGRAVRGWERRSFGEFHSQFRQICQMLDVIIKITAKYLLVAQQSYFEKEKKQTQDLQTNMIWSLMVSSMTQNASTRSDNSTIQQVLVMQNAARDHEGQENIEGRVKR